MVKNVSKDKKLYVNQIPEELLMRLIITTTDKGDLAVASYVWYKDHH